MRESTQEFSARRMSLADDWSSRAIRVQTVTFCPLGGPRMLNRYLVVGFCLVPSFLSSQVFFSAFGVLCFACVCLRTWRKRHREVSHLR